jgi:hypothetical protein
MAEKCVVRHFTRSDSFERAESFERLVEGAATVAPLAAGYGQVPQSEGAAAAEPFDIRQHQLSKINVLNSPEADRHESGWK